MYLTTINPVLCLECGKSNEWNAYWGEPAPKLTKWEKFKNKIWPPKEIEDPEDKIYKKFKCGCGHIVKIQKEIDHYLCDRSGPYKVTWYG